jgi:hypothetical protein
MSHKRCGEPPRLAPIAPLSPFLTPSLAHPPPAARRPPSLLPYPPAGNGVTWLSTEAPMTEQERELGRRWFDEVWNKGRREAIAELLSPDSVLHEAGIDSKGPDGFYPLFDRLRRLSPRFTSKSTTPWRTAIKSAFAGHSRASIPAAVWALDLPAKRFKRPALPSCASRATSWSRVGRTGTCSE